MNYYRFIEMLAMTWAGYLLGTEGAWYGAALMTVSMLMLAQQDMRHGMYERGQ